MDQPTASLPIVRRLPDDLCLVDVFSRLSCLPGCLWLDSASRGPDDLHGQPIGRYSFLTADPIETLVAFAGDPDPWPTLAEWCRRLPQDKDPLLPAFQGGIAGLLGYEAATWLEQIATAAADDLPTPAISLGLYDWTMAFDHLQGQGWIISQGLAASDECQRRVVACERADYFEKLLLGSSAADVPVAGQEILSVEPGQNQTAADLDCRAVPLQQQYQTDHPSVTSNFTSDQFKKSIAEVVRAIRAGDSFQVNLAQRLLARQHLSSTELYLRLRERNPAPFSAYYGGDDFAVLSSSPEGFLQVRGSVVETRPIKGTVPRTGHESTDHALAKELSSSEKDRAENVMIVDLMRNDLSRVCLDESVRVQQLCELERYEFVQHLVSVVTGELQEGKTVVDLLRACFPGGSVTGAPKIEAMRTIARLEPNPRGPYCGSIGYISCGGDADFNILIRTITAAHGHWQFPVGGGITARSTPASEEAETWAKAKGMLRAVQQE
ncbi:MAG: anthranilate synthase component I family protein [Rubripirellula sp.]|nr:anthranilate synthase component I family protein [Rubripirellula sp.]